MGTFRKSHPPRDRAACGSKADSPRSAADGVFVSSALARRQVQLAAQQHQAFMDHLHRERGRHVLAVVRRAHRVHVDRDDVEAGEPAEELEAFAREQAAPARRPASPCADHRLLCDRTSVSGCCRGSPRMCAERDLGIRSTRRSTTVPAGETHALLAARGAKPCAPATIETTDPTRT